MKDSAIVEGHIKGHTERSRTVEILVSVPKDTVPPWLLEDKSPVALARLMSNSVNNRAIYGDEARTLRQSPFFRSPAVWVAISPTGDNTYKMWLWQQKCLFHGQMCSGDIIAAHVSITETIAGVQHGAHGTGIKAHWSMVPLCNFHHQKQHNEGYSALANKGYWMKMRLQYVEQWAWEALRGILGYDSWAEVEPADLSAWANARGVEQYLPPSYQV